MLSPSRSCSFEGCKSASRTVCICCEKSYCLEHLAQHFVRINQKVPPLSDKINGLAKRLNKFSSIEPSYLIALEKWRGEAHRTVEEYYETKRRDIVDDRREKLKKEIERVRNTMDKLLRKHNAVKEDVDLLQQDVRLIEQKFTEFQSLRFTIHPLVIDENLIIQDILPLPIPCRTFKLPFDEFPAMAANEKQLLIHQPPNLSLLDRHFSMIKEAPWTHDDIWDICWSSALSRFIVVTNKEVFTIDHNTMTFVRCPISDQVEWSRVTCSDTSLFLLTQGLGPSIFECKLPPTNKGMKERHAPETCETCEYIFDLKSNHQSLAMVIYNTENGETRLDLRSSTNLQRLWSVDVGQGFRCCLLHGEKWMVADALSRRLFYISNNGKLLKVDKYLYQPWNIIQWGKYIIGVRTAEGINLH
jgi:prefoldin subunit 5